MGNPLFSFPNASPRQTDTTVVFHASEPRPQRLSERAAYLPSRWQPYAIYILQR